MKVLHLLYSLGTLNQIKSSQGSNSASRYYTNINPFILNMFNVTHQIRIGRDSSHTRFPWLYTFLSLLKSSSVC